MTFVCVLWSNYFGKCQPASTTTRHKDLYLQAAGSFQEFTGCTGLGAEWKPKEHLLGSSTVLSSNRERLRLKTTTAAVTSCKCLLFHEIL